MAKALVKDTGHIRLGVVGMTEGNGHPYSWSAILNGYDRERMTKECPFPGIPSYLNAQAPEAFGIDGVRVTHVFCDDRKAAGHVAGLARVPHVVDTPEAMIGKVDAVLIATDIGGEHVKRARPFVEAGVPVFIDKPLCDRAEDLAVFERWVAEGAAILSSSSTRFAAEYAPYQYPHAPLGDWRFISMSMAKSWETYGIHALEAVYSITGPGYVSVRNTGTAERNVVHLKHRCGADVVIACGKGVVYGGAMTLCGSQGNATVVTKDTFSSFKAQLAEFAGYLKSGERPYPFSHTVELMRLVIGGIVSRDRGGEEVAVCEDNAQTPRQVPAEEARTQTLYRHARQRIPGGTQLLSKRPEMLAPDQWPPYFSEARGCETWDLDGRHYYDFSTNGIGSCLLGFRDPEVTSAVQRRLSLGSMCTLNAPEEVELADELCGIHPWAEQVRFARCGGEACAVAVRIARATTDRSVVAICGYSGWQDWYLAANLGDSDALRGHLLPGLDPLGVPRELRGTAVPFVYNRRDQFDALLAQYGDRLAAVIMEPCRSQDPEPGFLEYVRDGAHRVGALLIFDEITIGFRMHFGGAHLKLGVMPDLAVFAKALGNGHPMAAVIGTRVAMSGANDSFISSTYWTESVGPVAALATLRKMKTIDLPGHVARIGTRVQRCWEESARRHSLPVHVGGYPCLAHFSFTHPQGDALRTLYTQQMLGLGFLAGTGLYPTLAHTDVVVDRYVEAVDQVFGELAQALAQDDVLRRLRGPVAHSGFKRLL